MIRRPLALLIALAVLLAPTPARADEPRELPSETTIVPAPGGVISVLDRAYRVPEGTRLYTPPAYEKIDAELRSLQADKTRRDAENAHLRMKMQSWQPGWRVLIITAVVGLAGGIYLGIKL